VTGTVLITGASGYVGSRVLATIAERGWMPTRLGRSGADIHFDLADSGSLSSLPAADALVHLSYDFSPRTWPEIQRVNVEGSRRLMEGARAQGVDRIVCISSTAAFTGTRSLYGRAKLEIERIALGLGATVIRPGLVWGDEPGAMFASLGRIVSRLPIVPLIAPADLPVLMVKDTDLGLLVDDALRRPDVFAGHLAVAAARTPIGFEALLRSIAHANGCHPRFLGTPWRLAWGALRGMELVGLNPPFRSDSLVSLVAVDRAPFAEQTLDPEATAVDFRPYPL
jgi:nucleoside-diphosphate-sugar epimerase